MKKSILGISAFYHDSAAALLVNGEIVAAAQEERFTRKKHDESFPKNAIEYCLDYAGICVEDLTSIVFYDKPLLKFERLIETYFKTAPVGRKSFVAAMPVWIKEKMFLKNILRKELQKLTQFQKGHDLPKFYFPEHHLSHAASAFYPSPFEKAAILTVDGVGEWATTTIAIGNKNSITMKKEIRFPHSVGLLYSAFTYYTGFKVNSGEYKLMGLAPYGNPKSSQTKGFIEKIKKELITLKEDGSIFLNMQYFAYEHDLKMINEKLWWELFGVPTRKPETEISQVYMNLAFAIQNVTEEILLKMAIHTREITGQDNLVMAGGVALNCVANGLIQKSNVFNKIWLQPAAGDAGGALGAAYVGWYIGENQKRIVKENQDKMQGAFLGPEYSDIDIEKMTRKFDAHSEHYSNFETLAKKVANIISEGNVVGWFQGRMEWGPRALGNRSILGDPRNQEMQKKLNLKIKYRESFRPFAPSVIEEETENYFEQSKPSPYMLIVSDIQEKLRHDLPKNYHELSIKKKLYYTRSELPAITHLDFSARVQTVSKETSSRYWKLIDEFKNITGYGVIINTSFNVRGEPIVMTPTDAYRCFMNTEMDYLIIGNFLFEKLKQPKIDANQKLEQHFTLD